MVLKHGLKFLTCEVCRKRGGAKETLAIKGQAEHSCCDILHEFDISNLTELYKRSCRDLNEYKAMLAHDTFDKELFDLKSQAAFTRRLKQRIGQLERTIDQHLIKLLERPGAASKNY